MSVVPCISHTSNISVCIDANKKTEEKGDTKTESFEKEYPDLQMAKEEIYGLMERLECAENKILHMARILQHLSTMKNIRDKISAMSPSPNYAEGKEMRRHMWDIERRISALKEKFQKRSTKASLLEKQRKISISSENLEDRKHNRQQFNKKNEESIFRISESDYNKPESLSGKSFSFKSFSSLRRIGSSSSEGTSFDKIDGKSLDMIMTSSVSSVVRFEIPLETLEVLEELDSKKKKRKPSQISMRISPTKRILGGDVTVRECLRQINERIYTARDEFSKTRKSMYQLSKALFHVKDVVDLDSLCHCSKEMDQMKSALNSLTGGQYESAGKVDFVHNKRLRKSEELLKDFDLRMRKIGNMNIRIDRFNRNVRELESNLSILFGRLDAGLPLRSGPNDNPTIIIHLFKAIKILEQNVKDVSKVPPQLNESERQRDAAVDAIEEYVELLGIIKLDKIDLNKAISEKATADQLERKVLLSDVAERKTKLNLLVNKNINSFKKRDMDRKKEAKNLQNLLNTKIGLEDLLDFEKFLNKKYKNLVSEIEMTPEVQHQIETAGTRKMLSEGPLCSVCCAAERRRARPRSPRGALTPYHAYELRALQKQQLRLLDLKNMELPDRSFPLDWQNILEKQGPHRNKKQPDRYIGGKFTKTTPQQRLVRRIPCDELPMCHHEEI